MKISAFIIGAAALLPTATALGSVKDSNGCIPTAGYSWCESTQQCQRPWEEECPDVVDVDDSEVADTKPCESGAFWCGALKKCVQYGDNDVANQCPTATARRLQIGGTKDDNGCLTSAGYSWCDATSKCQRKWEEACASDTVTTTQKTTTGQQLIGGKGDGVCCTTCGYSYCKALDKCVQIWTLTTTEKGQCFPELVKD